MKKIARSAMFAVSIEVNDYFLRSLKKTPEIIAEAMKLGAEFWHDNFLEEHFQRGAYGKYGYAKRSFKYLTRSNKKGKPYLVLSGSLQRDLKASFAIKENAQSAELKMRARVLNFVPNMANSAALQVPHLNGKMYPNIKREVKVILPAEMEQLTKVITKHMIRRYQESLA